MGLQARSQNWQVSTMADHRKPTEFSHLIFYDDSYCLLSFVISIECRILFCFVLFFNHKALSVGLLFRTIIQLNSNRFFYPGFPPLSFPPSLSLPPSFSLSLPPSLSLSLSLCASLYLHRPSSIANYLPISLYLHCPLPHSHIHTHVLLLTQVPDRSSCGSFYWSCSPTPVTGHASPGKARRASSS